MNTIHVGQLQHPTFAAVGCSLAALLFALPAHGATEPVRTSRQAKVLQRVTVTGTYIPTKPDEVVVPVTVIGPAQIRASGVTTNALDLLRKVAPFFAGRSDIGSSNANNTNQNTAGGSQIALRNLDTLVLVDGRRMAVSGIAGIGGKSFVDINEIPVAAIQRIEILSDGASAIYGSDAIGGVVNIILRKHFRGAEAGVRYGSADGGYTQKSGYFIAGTRMHGVSVTVTGTTSKNSPLYQYQRPFSANLSGRLSNIPGTVGYNGKYPGAILAPGLDSPSQSNPTGINATATSIGQLVGNGTYLAESPAQIAAGYNLSDYQTLMLRQQQNALAATLSADLLPDDRLTAFGDLLLSRTNSFAQFLPINTAVTVPQGASYNPVQGTVSQVTFGDLARPKQFYDYAHAFRISGGLKGTLGTGWRWQATLDHSQNALDQQQRNVIYGPNLPLAIAGGYDANGNPVAGGGYSKVYGGFSQTGGLVLQPALDPFATAAGLSPAMLANLYGTEYIHTFSKLDALDARVVGNAFELPGGPIGVAVGMSYRREYLSAYTDPNGTNTGPTAQRWIGGTYADPFAKSRIIRAVFGEVRVPITGRHFTVTGARAFDLIGAVRAEHYSYSGGKVVPKAGFFWQPVDSQVTFRGSISKSFTAPTLYAMFGPTDTRQVGAGVIQTVFGIPGLQFNGEDGNNPGLKPSTAITRFLGVTIAPRAVRGLTLALDFSQVDQHGFPGGIGFTNILQSVNELGAASPFVGNVTYGNFPGLPGAQPFTAPGQLLAYLQAGNNENVYAVDRFTNLGGIRVRSFNLTGQYYLPTADHGTFIFSTNAVIFTSYLFQALPIQPFFQYAGAVTNGGTGVQGTIPRYSVYSNVDWRYDHWDLTVANTYLSAVQDQGAGGIVYWANTARKSAPVPGYMAWDLHVGYRHRMQGSILKSWSVALGVNDMFNRLPPVSPLAYANDNNADAATYSPIGRLVYCEASIRF